MNDNTTDYNRNSGFSLLEVLVAMIVLAIIAIPLVRGFVVTANLNSKTRNLERAESAAQNLMEALIPYSLEDICKQFNSDGEKDFTIYTNFVPSGSDTSVSLTDIQNSNDINNSTNENNSTQYFLLDETNSDYLRKEVMTGITSDDFTSDDLANHSCLSWDNDKDKFIRQDDGLYEFAMQNIYVDGKYYDAIIDIDARKYGSGQDDSGSSTSTSTSYYETYNTEIYSEVASYNASYDYMFLQNYTDDAAMYQELRLDLGLDSTEYTDDIMGACTKRTITVTIDENVASTKVSYEYLPDPSSPAKYYTYSASDFSGNISSSGYEQLPRNIFICYAPNYYSTALNNSSTTWLDNIVIANNSETPVNVVIIKQLTDELGTIASYESAYRVKVEIKEPSHSKSDLPTDTTKIITNLDVNIGYTGLVVAVSNQARYVYTASDVSASGKASDMVAYLSISDLSNESQSDKMYSITIRIYEQGAYRSSFLGYEPILVLTENN